MVILAIFNISALNFIFKNFNLVIFELECNFCLFYFHFNFDIKNKTELKNILQLFLLILLIVVTIKVNEPVVSAEQPMPIEQLTPIETINSGN